MPWYRRMAVVARRQVALKSFGTMAFIAVFFGAYFYLLKNPAYPITVMPFTALDQLIGFYPLSMPLYVSLWVYVSLPSVLLATRSEMVAYTSGMTGACLTGLAIFYFWPTAVPAPDIDWALHPGVDFLKNIDAAGNACPSLHVATAVFCGFWLNHLLGRFNTPRWLLALNWLWCAGIVYSTLATRQHVVLDVAGGALLGGLAAWLSLRRQRQRGAAVKIRLPAAK